VAVESERLLGHRKKVRSLKSAERRTDVLAADTADESMQFLDRKK